MLAEGSRASDRQGNIRSPIRSPSNPVTKPLHRVVSTSRFKSHSEETFVSQNTTIFSSSVWNTVDDISDEKMRWEFFKFCFGFSMGCTMTILAIFYSPLLTTETIGGSGSGVFYVSFALCSVGGAKFVVNRLGVRRAILFGHVGSSFYVTAFLLMTEFTPHSVLFYFNIGVCVLGGVSQAIMWTGLGKYTIMMSNLLISSMETGVIREMNRKLINHFALVYIVNLILGFLVALVLVYVSIYLEGTLIFLTLPAQLTLLVVSTYLLWNIDNLNDMGNPHQTLYSSLKGVRDMLHSLADMESTNRYKLLLLLPYHVSWGVTTAFWILYLVRNIFYDEISFLAAAYALFFSYLFSFMYTILVKAICPQLNHNFHILIGGISSFVLAICALSIDGYTRHQGREDYRIVVLFALLYGVSMSVYENNMRAEVANLLLHYEVLAYSATSFAKSMSAGVCLISSTIVLRGREHGGQFGLEVELIISSILGIVGFIGAVLIDRRSNSSDVVEQMEEKLLRDSERNSIIDDMDSLYSNHTNSTSFKKEGNNLFPTKRSSNTVIEDVIREGLERESYTSSRASSATEDEYFVPDYF